MIRRDGDYPFVKATYKNPRDYVPRTDAPPLIEKGIADTRHDLFETHAPAHTRRYFNGLDVVTWTQADGAERSQLIIDQRAGSLVLPFAKSHKSGFFAFLQENFRVPHSKNEYSVMQHIARRAFDNLGVWSLEAPAGGIKYQDGNPIETPEEAAVRELLEETGLILPQHELLNLLRGGLSIGGDVSTKVTHLFAADVSKGDYDPDRVVVEADETIGNLLAFRVRDGADLWALRGLTRLCAGTSNAITALPFHPEIGRLL